MMSAEQTSRQVYDDAFKRLTLLGQHGKSRLWWAEYRSPEGTLDPDNAHYFLQLVGTYAERGHAYGYLMAEQIIASTTDTTAFYAPPSEWARIAESRVVPNLPFKYPSPLKATMDPKGTALLKMPIAIPISRL